jgi:hypothetical protein
VEDAIKRPEIKNILMKVIQNLCSKTMLIKNKVLYIYIESQLILYMRDIC